MGLFDKLKAYLNEDDPDDFIDEESKKEESKGKKSKKDKEKKVNKMSKDNAKASQKTEEQSQADESNGAPDVVMQENDLTSPIDMRKNVQEYCEQLIDVNFNMKDMKREYSIVTSYLTDIQRIEELPVEIANEIVDNAKKIEMLDVRRQTLQQSEKLLSEEQFNTIATYEDEVLDTIVKLNEMEIRDSMIRSDMGHLEGEKEALKYQKTECIAGINKIRTAVIVIMAVFFVAVAIVLYFAMEQKQPVAIYILAIGALAMAGFAICYMKYADLKNEMKQEDAKIKKAVSLSNKVKVKFINNTNTLDFIYDKYGVNSCKELEYVWEQYNRMVSDAAKYSKANTDFKIYCDELVARLKRVGVADPLVWPNQTKALIDRREMVEIKHNLNTRRQKIRERILTSENIRRTAIQALKKGVAENPGLMSYVDELLKPYDISLEE